jgi:hypothetical protein
MDLEKVLRQTVVKKIAPNLIIQLYESLSHVHEITIHSEVLRNETIETACLTIMKEINDQIDLTKIGVQNENTIFKMGVNRDLDNLINEVNSVKSHIDAIQGFFNMIMRSNGPTSDDTEYVRMVSTEKSGSTLQMTKTRAKNLKILLDKGDYKTAPWYKGTANCSNLEKGIITFRNYEIDFSDLKFKSATTSNDELSFIQLTKLFMKMFSLESAIEKKNTELYNIFVEQILENRCFPLIESVINYVIEIDALQCRAYVAKEYKYSLILIYVYMFIAQLLFLLEPYVLGKMIDGLLIKEYFWMLCFICIAVFENIFLYKRMVFDTKVYTKIYNDIVLKYLVRNKDVDASTKIARADMSNNIINFLEHDMHYYIYATISVIGTLLFIFLGNPLTGFVVISSIVPIVMIVYFLYKNHFVSLDPLILYFLSI